MKAVSYKDAIAVIASATGYDVEFLWEKWNEMCEDGDPDFGAFCGISFELDW